MPGKFPILDIHRAGQAAVAEVFGITRQAVAKWDCPRNPGKRTTYDLPAVVAWKLEQLQEKLDLLSSDADSSYLEEYRKYRARRERLGVEEMERELVPMDELKTALAPLASILRRAGDTLRRRFGEEARAVLDEAITEYVKETGEVMG